MLTVVIGIQEISSLCNYNLLNNKCNKNNSGFAYLVLETLHTGKFM